MQKDIAQKVSKYGVFLVGIFPYFDTFHAVFQQYLGVYVNFENGFACYKNFENDHPEKATKISEICNKNICGGV